MKKIISLLTVITILLSTTAFAENSYADLTDSDACYSHVMRLTDFGFIAGYEDGTFKPDNYVTRAETAKLACVARNADGSFLDTDPSHIKSPYSDMEPNRHWAFGYVIEATGMGAVSGYDDGTFRPENTVTYDEYIKIFVSLLGYASYAEHKGGYPLGYIEVAKDMKLTDGIVFRGDDIVTRDNAAIIMDRALDVPLAVINGYTRNEEGQWVPEFNIMDGTGKDNKTLLTKFHNIYTVSGTIGEN